MANGLLGVVLCGGKSLRMGRDKGLIGIGDTVWAVLMQNKLINAGLQVVVSINNSQVPGYHHFFSAGQLVVDFVNIDGPLAGLLSVHFQYRGDDLLLVACDMIDLKPQTIAHMVATQKQQPGYDFYVYQNEAFAEPFCAIYTANGLKKLIGQVGEPDLSSISFQRVFNMGITKRLPIIEPESFANYNTL